MPQFGDGKEPGALRTIGEVAEALGIKPHVLRYWEDQFPALRPLKRAGGRRLYRPEDVALVQRIATLLGREGYTLKGARAALAGVPATSGPATVEPGPVAPEAGDILDRLKAIRRNLAAAIAS